MHKTLATDTVDKATDQQIIRMGREVIRLGREMMTHDGTAHEGFAKRLAGMALIAKEYDTTCALNAGGLDGGSACAAIRDAVQDLWARFESGAPLNDIKAEAVKVGALSLRFIVDVCLLTDSTNQQINHSTGVIS
jgi:hypothetical protein